MSKPARADRPDPREQRELLIAKLVHLSRYDLAEPFERCGTEETLITCLDCFKRRVVLNRCDNRFCPACGPLRARRRVEELAVWAAQLKQPKHLVLTSRNTARLTRERIAQNLRGIAAIRRLKCHANWKSGSWSMELTNETRGWHLHFHLLIETRWIEMERVALAWAHYVGQEDAAIVKVKDVRERSYAREVAKYICKPEQFVHWKAREIVEAIDAFKGRRAFGVFGEAVGQRDEWKRTCLQLRRDRAKCDCGSCNYTVEPLVHGLTRQERGGR